MKMFKPSKLVLGLYTALGTILVPNAIASENENLEQTEKDSFLEKIIVTGSARKGTTALETSYGVAILDSDDINKTNPVGLTAVVDAVPGLQGEFSNGETNSNLNVRGTQGGFISFISLQEDGLPVQYSPFFAEFELRNDLSYQGVETILGGPSGIFTAQGAGATINYISRRPKGEPEGEIAFSVTDYGQFRTDFFYGGDINDNGWSGAVGGFFRQGDAIRDTGFTAAKGGQLRASLSKEFENGSITFAYKKIDDTSPYFNPLPTDTSNPDSPQALTGFDAQRDSLMGPDVRILNSRRPGGEIVQRDLADGNMSQTDQLTISFDYFFDNGWSLSEKARFSNIKTTAHDFRGSSDAGLMDAEAYVASQIEVLQGAFPDVDSVQLVRVNDGEVIANPSTLNGNGLLAIHDLIEYERATDNFINDFRVNWESDDSDILLTFGLQSWWVDTKSSNPQDQFLIDIRSNANRYNIQGLNSQGEVVANLTDAGVITHGSLDNYGGLETESHNFYFNGEFQVTSNLRIDLGLRHEEASANAFAEDVSFFVPIEGMTENNILADDARLITRNGNIYTGTIDYETDSYTIGGNYTISDNFAVYARIASAEDMNFANEFTFYNIPAFGAEPGSNLGLSDEPADLTFSEIGARYIGDDISGYITYFDTKHKNAGSIVASDTGAAEVLTSDTLASGVEFWLDYSPITNLDLNFSGVVMDAKRESAAGTLPINRVPETQLRFAPSYSFSNASIFASVQYYSKRNHDDSTVASAVTLPAYTQIDLGIDIDVLDDFTIGLRALNVTDELGFTSANFRGIVPSAPVRYSSTIPGRNFSISINYSF